MKKFIYRKSVLVLWVCAYILMILTPILFNAVVFSQSQRVLENKVMDVNQNSMELLKRELDDQLRNMLNAYIDLSYNSSIQKIAAMGNTKSGGYQYEMYQTVQNLRKFEDYVSEYEDYYIYFKKIGLVVSGKEPVSEQLFFSDMGATDISFEQWKEQVQSGGSDYMHYTTADGA